MRVIAAAVIGFLCLPTAALAQVPKGNVFIGYSYLNADTNINRVNVNGWNGSLEMKVFPFVGAVADFSSHYADSTTCVSPGCATSLNGRVDSYLFGPRVSASVGPVRPFVHALFGAAHTKASGGIGGSAPTDTAFATALGGGVDLKLLPILGWRVQGDLLRTNFFNTSQNNVRLSTGIVIRF